MRPTEAIEALRKAPWYKGQIVAIHVIEGSGGLRIPVPQALHPSVRKFLDAAGISTLFMHQARALERVWAGANVILATPTASGKTLAFLLPVLDALARDQDATALFLYPLKALTNDQMQTLIRAEELSGIDILPAIYDGDTPSTRRPGIRQTARVILSNPYEIHETLPYHGLWRRFFRHLAFIVIDEAHRYSGVFGSHVAQVIRRLLRVTKAYGASPRFILASASIANPDEHAKALTSAECEVILGDEAPSPTRHLVLFDTTRDALRSAHAQARDAVLALIEAGLKTLCFARSRRTAEFLASLLADAPVAPYRAGYLPEERRRIERDFKEGRLMGVVSTSAMELGIDIGDLDAVVVFGYPGTISAFWQQIGRAGRRGAESLGIFIAQEDILDQYLVRHPEPILAKTYERATVDLTNEHILAGHMLCAASEMPVAPQEQGSQEEICRILQAKGLLRTSAKGLIYAGLSRPHEAVRLDYIDAKSVALVDAESGTILETMAIDRAMREAHPGAVYLHQAKTYVVETLDLEGLVAKLRREDVDFYTQALVQKTVEVLDALGSLWLCGAKAFLAKIRVTSKVTGFLRKRFGCILGSAELDMPERTFDTKALVIELSGEVPKGVGDLLGALHGLEHTLVALAPLHLGCDPSDLAGLSTLQSPSSGNPAIFLYDGHPGGIGLADRFLETIEARLAEAARHLLDCPCEGGCPSCCLSPSCGNDNQPMDKRGAALLALQWSS